MSGENFSHTVHGLKQTHSGSEFGQAVANKAQNKNAAEETAAAETPNPVEEMAEVPADVQQDKAILEASFDGVSLSAGGEPMILTYKAAVEKINEILSPELGVERPIDTALEEGLDVSPEATADRIVSLTTALYSRYQEANPELEGAALVDQFVDVIAGGIEQGFNEARDILNGLGVLEGDIAANIDRTFELVQEGLQAFREANGGSVVTEGQPAPLEGTVEDSIDPLLSE